MNLSKCSAALGRKDEVGEEVTEELTDERDETRNPFESSDKQKRRAPFQALASDLDGGTLASVSGRAWYEPTLYPNQFQPGYIRPSHRRRRPSRRRGRASRPLFRCRSASHTS